MSKNSSEKKLHLINDYDHTVITEWLVANKKNILMGFIGLMVFFLILYKVFSIRTTNAEVDYLNAGTAFEHIESNEEKQESLTQLQGILERQPDLRAKYDADVAQILIIDQDAKAATPFADSVFKRSENQGVDLYRAYGETTLLIAAKEYDAALTSALDLKNKMGEEKQDAFGNPLYGLNLIRIAVLQQALNHPEKELQAWEEVQKFAALEELAPIFTDGKASLQGYIEHRKVELKL